MFNKFIKNIIHYAIILTVLIGFIPQNVSAASQGIFFNQSYTMGIGSEVDNGTQKTKQLVYFSPKKGATYSAVSNNSNIKVTEVKAGFDSEFLYDIGKVFLTGVNTGDSTLTLKETIKGKTKTVGTMSIKVKGTTVGALGNYNHEFGLGTNHSLLSLINKNPNASYEFKSNKNGLDFSVVNNKDVNSTDIMMNATEYGTFVVSALETINGKTRKIKDITFQIKPTEIPDTFLSKTTGAMAHEFVKYQDTNYNYGLSIKGQDTFDRGPSNYNNNPDSTISHKDYDVYSITLNETNFKLGILSANKPTTVVAELYRSPKGIEDESQTEFIKNVKITFDYKW